ncbi:membrane-bound dehydrogenase domain protein [Planctopirus limnophila DSM 3776]|uniref:Membrane-bound dehydrogenase domain protein n=1 Tax=Planctopirus limnophila (strain ATCC 43296 / DSM 3776 / IFAM 1008 / Mu 290) TaxID=521674 RepID=D5SQU5_PLAL2|nr:PVC-type heme-binding CxxCH protein [Planctopirus limnophila]ADG68557.1 membrane-bound dehydrogenase domain protein [Planctopirus limnophila DSM 3776]
MTSSKFIALAFASFLLTSVTIHVSPLDAQTNSSREESLAAQSTASTPADSSSAFPAPFNTEKSSTDSSMPAGEAAAKTEVPSGLKVNVFATEPDVQNPIAMCWDSLGRLWILENYTYAERTQRFEPTLRDRLLILEDKDRDGVMDQRKVFTDDIRQCTSIAIGHGGVWLLALPQLIFIPDANHDDIPDGPAQVMLDGFEVARENHHNFANGLKWGPDGWLYGRCGGSCPARVGLPDAPPEERVALEGGIWRYHPVSREVEVLTTGTTNPWGHDWNAFYEIFFVNTVNGHLWHAIPGAHYTRPFTLDPNTRTYGLIDQHADHYHFDTGKSWTASRDGAASSLGGGHAHSGTMIYLGGQWPEEYRGQLFTLNFHGRRINVEQLDREGSGYVARHKPDMFLSPDAWFRGIDLDYGPDGNVYVLDWSDTGECHEHTGVHRTSGRIYRISSTSNSPLPPKPPNKTVPFHAVNDLLLVPLLQSTNEWDVRQARLELAHRARAKTLDPETFSTLQQLFAEMDKSSAGKAPEEFAQAQLRLLVTIGTIAGMQQQSLPPQTLALALQSPHESVRAWAIRLATDRLPIDDAMSRQRSRSAAEQAAILLHARQQLPMLLERAQHDPSPFVRLVLASTLQRLPVELRPQLAALLMKDARDDNDHNLPLMVWYGLIPVAEAVPQELVKVFQESQWPSVRQKIVRRLAEDLESHPEHVDALVAKVVQQKDPAQLFDLAAGLTDGLKGWRKAKAPNAWPQVIAVVEATPMLSNDAKLKTLLTDLNLLFGDGRAMADVRRVATDSQSDPANRLAALATLSENHPDDLDQILVPLLKEARFNVAAAKGLANWNHPRANRPQIGQQIVASYRSFRAPVRPEIISLLATRREYAQALIKGLEEGRIPTADITAFDVRQMRALKDPALDEALTKLWGEARETTADKRLAIEQLKEKLTGETLAKASLGDGRVLFTTHCAKCHKLYGEGGAIGPDLTGAQRSNLDYLLENILDPSSVVSKDYRMSVAELEDGRVLSGIIVEQTPRTLTLQTQTEKLTIERSEIVELTPTNLSPMPDGILQPLSESQIRDLIAYLKHPQQVALPAR